MWRLSNFLGVCVTHYNGSRKPAKTYEKYLFLPKKWCKNTFVTDFRIFRLCNLDKNYGSSSSWCLIFVEKTFLFRFRDVKNDVKNCVSNIFCIFRLWYLQKYYARIFSYAHSESFRLKKYFFPFVQDLIGQWHLSLKNWTRTWSVLSALRSTKSLKFWLVYIRIARTVFRKWLKQGVKVVPLPARNVGTRPR